MRHLIANDAENGRKDSARASRDGSDFKLVGFPFVGGNTMLLRASPHNHGSPVWAADGRQNSAGMQRPGTFAHQLMQDRSIARGKTDRTEPIAADDDDVFHLRYRGG